VPRASSSFDLVALAKDAKAPRPLLLAIWGLYGGKYAKLFDPPFNDIASGICIFAMAAGIVLLLTIAVRSVFRF
jgi:hypothetical protein